MGKPGETWNFQCVCANSEEAKTLFRSRWDGPELVPQGHKDGRNKTSLGSLVKLVAVSAAIRFELGFNCGQARERNVVYE